MNENVCAWRASQETTRCSRCARPVRWRADHPREVDGQRCVSVNRWWPEGPICSGCVAKAVETYGVCDGCGVDRLLPGVGPNAQRWCTDCGGGLGDFSCTRCAREGWRERAGVCGWCVLGERVTELLDDGNGRVRPELEPLFERITTMARPRSGILWLSRPEPQGILRAIARGEVPLTHEGVHTLAPKRSSIYIRDLLVAAGVLAPVDRFLFLFEQWWPAWLETIDDPAHQKTLRHFLTWHFLRAFRALAAERPLGFGPPQSARRHLRMASWLLVELDERQLTLATCTQGDLDQIFAAGKRSLRDDLQPFLRWAMNTRRMPRLATPAHLGRPVALITQHQRIALIRRIYHDNQMALIDRVLALFVLLYAQSLTRIHRLTVDDFHVDDDGQLLVRLGEPPAPIPPPFDRIVLEHIKERTNQTTATNPGSNWLFPGRRAGQPLATKSLRLRMQHLGIPNLTSRSRAIRELLRQAPPAVVAGMLGYSPNRSESLAAEYGATWQRYPGIGRQPRRPPRIND